MKQGSGDDPFAEDEPEDDEEEPEAHPEPEQSTAGAQLTSSEEPTSRSRGGVQRQSLPYIHSRDGVKDGRTQRPVFLRDHVEAGIGDLVDEMESELGEDVYKTDVTEAAMVVAQEHPELMLAKLEEWGYGWD